MMKKIVLMIVAVLLVCSADAQAAADMVLIPGGEFEMGDHHDGMTNALPVHSVYVDSFYVSRYEVTNQQYCDYLNSAISEGLIEVNGGVVYATGGSDPYCDMHSFDSDSQIDHSGGVFSVRTKNSRDMSNDPMVEVSWYGAKAYCDYYGYRLPTEAEWEYAARAGEYNPYYRFPWGDTISHSQANYFASSSYPYDVNPTSGFHPDWDDGIYPYTAPVGSFSPNAYGLYEMAGNIRDWCNDWYSDTYYQECNSIGLVYNPQGSVSGNNRVMHGGSWGDGAGGNSVAHRIGRDPSTRTNDYGFRVASTPEPPLIVAIDIKPDSNDNPINLDSHGLVPVAIFSSDGLGDFVSFDANSVDPNTVELAGARVVKRGKGKFMAHEEDVNEDGLLDLVVQVATDDLDPNSLEDGFAILTAKTYDGQDIEGQDEITIVPTEQ